MKHRNFFKTLGALLGEAPFWRGRPTVVDAHIELASNSDEWRRFDAAVQKAHDEVAETGELRGMKVDAYAHPHHGYDSAESGKG